MNRSMVQSTPPPDGWLPEQPTKRRHGRHDPSNAPDWHAWAVLLTMVLMLICLFHETFPPFIVLLTALAVVWNLGVISSSDAIKGFSNPALVTLAALFVVVQGADRAGLISRVARLCLGTGSSEKVALMRFCSLVFVVGGFMSNTALVALLMPIIRDWARRYDFAPSKFLLPMAYSSMAGGYTCILGASTHLMINGMMVESTGESFGFFAPLPLGLSAALFGMWYLLTLGVKLLPDHRGGLFRTLKEKTSDMVTEVQVMNECPLVGVAIFEAMERLGIPRGALLKIVRQPTLPANYPQRRPRQQDSGRVPPRFGRQVSGEAAGPPPDRFGISPASAPSADGAARRSARSASPLARQAAAAAGRPEALAEPTYGDRTRQWWGTFPRPSKRRRALTDSTSSPRLKAMRQNKKNGMEIFPVPEHEVLEGGDVLFLSLPQQDCIALVGSQHVAGLLRDLSEAQTGEECPVRGESSDSVSETGGEDDSKHDVTKSLRICDVDLLEVPGRESEFVELVVSRTNPFIGRALEGAARLEFEKHYQVAILAIRNNWAETSDQLPSRMYSRQGDFKKVILSGDSSEFDPDERALRELRQPPLGPGDAVLVLTRLEDFQRYGRRRDFLATTAVAQKADGIPDILDFVPSVLFLVALLLVTLGVVGTDQAMVGLMVIYLVGGWVTPSEVSECVDWNMLILVGSALGLATAVQASGLSSRAAVAVEKMNLGTHGTVFVLYLFTMLLSELVTNSAAAALGFPLALDLSNALELDSVKPLAMTVMLASATCFASPISSPCTLMVMGPGGYSFVDYIKVGLALDVIYWLVCSTMLPAFYPM